MKTIIIGFSLLMLTMSCKNKITNVEITAFENNKNYKCYMLNYGEIPDSYFLEHYCPWIKDPKNTVFIYMPISFKLENNTGSDLRISQIWDSFNSDTYQPIFIDDKYYKYIDGKVDIASGKSTAITLFVHLPVPINVLDKDHYNRCFRESNKRKLDSIVVDKINPELQKAIDASLKKKQIYISYHESKNVKERALAYYCVNRQKLGVFRSDSLAKLKTTFIYNCD